LHLYNGEHNSVLNKSSGFFAVGSFGRNGFERSGAKLVVEGGGKTGVAGGGDLPAWMCFQQDGTAAAVFAVAGSPLQAGVASCSWFNRFEWVTISFCTCSSLLTLLSPV